MDSNFFPVFINLENKKVLVIGAGKIAYRKVMTLIEYTKNIDIITREIKYEKFNELKLNVSLEELSLEELKNKISDNYFLVIAATDNNELNLSISDFCDKNNILVNNITSKTEMNVRFSSVIKNPEYTIGISANGDPKKAKTLKNKIESVLTLE